MQEALNQKIDAFIAANKEQILKDIATLVSINSVEGAPEEGAPYGAGPRAALDKTLELAAGMGLATRNCENHIGYAELAGADAEKYLATICHVDVVPEGNGWTEDPFKMEIRDGWMIGRGVADDKGPMVATLYALKFLKEEGVSLRYPIRALVGDNEETHMHDVDYYLANYPASPRTQSSRSATARRATSTASWSAPSATASSRTSWAASPPTLCLTAPALSWPPTSPSCATPPTSPSSRKATVSASAAGASPATLPCRKALSTPSVWW